MSRYIEFLQMSGDGEQVREIELGDGLTALRVSSGRLLEPVRDELVEELRSLWSSSLSRDIDDPLVVQDAEKYPFAEDNRVMLVLEGDRLAAIYLYSPVEYRGMKGVDIDICLVREEYQGRGIMPKLIRESIEETGAVFFKSHTQNPHMVQVYRRFAPKGYLYPIDGEVAGQGAEMARELCGKPDKFETPIMMEKSFYGGGSPLYGDRRERMAGQRDVKDFFEKNVDFQAGDAILLIGFMPDRF